MGRKTEESIVGQFKKKKKKSWNALACWAPDQILISTFLNFFKLYIFFASLNEVVLYYVIFSLFLCRYEQGVSLGSVKSLWNG